MRTFNELWCGLWTGHHDISVYDGNGWHLECLSCRRATPGWRVSSAKTPLALSTADINDTYQHLMDVELKLHGGG